MTLTFGLMGTRIMTHTPTKAQVQTLVGSKDGVETCTRTDAIPITLPSRLNKLHTVIKKLF